MNFIKKRAPGRLLRAIVSLAARMGNKLMVPTDNGRGSGLADAKQPDSAAKENEGQLKVLQRTTVTVETERLLIVRRELRPLGRSENEQSNKQQ